MEFIQGKLVERELEIAGYLAQGLSLNKIQQRTGLGKKLLNAHIRNIMEKLKLQNKEELIILFKEMKL